MRPLIAGNWKMNGLGSSLAEIAAVARSVAERPPEADVLICPPFTLIKEAVAAAGGRIAIGGQDCHAQSSGAFTGDVSADMLADAGASAVIVGHSERRLHHGETDSMVAAKVRAAWRAGLLAIVCVGEYAADCDAGRAPAVVAAQLDTSLPGGARAGQTVVAYEPVWAIGSGRTPSADAIVGMHGLIRARLESALGSEGTQIRILYGGSANSANAGAILTFANVNGLLVGSASLKGAEFLDIVRAAPG